MLGIQDGQLWRALNDSRPDIAVQALACWSVQQMRADVAPALVAAGRPLPLGRLIAALATLERVTLDLEFADARRGRFDARWRAELRRLREALRRACPEAAPPPLDLALPADALAEALQWELARTGRDSMAA